MEHPTNPQIPPKGMLFEPVEGPLGLRLALVFGNEGPMGKCPYYLKQCIHCDLGAGEGLRFTTEINLSRLEFFKTHYSSAFPQVNHLILYNSGSTLNPIELSNETLKEILNFANSLERVKRISFDSREAFVKPERVEFLTQNLRENVQLSVTLGLESQNDEVRLGKLAKRMRKEEVDKVFDALATKQERTSAEINILFQPPGLLGKAAIEEAIATVEYGLGLMDKFGVRVDFNFHPYYPSWKGTSEFPEHPRALLEDTIKALILITRKIKSLHSPAKIFIGWNDEGHDLQPAFRQREILLYFPCFKAFNISQDENDLRL